jgi:predicted RNase H-like nuclease (RuvC/YqgF family)
MKTVNKILTYVVSVMLVIAMVVCLMRGEWIEAILLSALLMEEWINNKQSESIEKLRKIGEELGVRVIDLTTKNGSLEKDKTALINDIATVDRDNGRLRIDLAEAKKREEIAHKTIESQRKEVCDLQSTVTALEAQLEAAQSQITTLKAKLSRKPRKPFPPQNVTPVKVEE